ncbi:MAG: hypothetical protein HY784_06945 [Chloroflexi bacterium]|nr:hypothetical protein [Chloroflexota bacterium]
MQETGRLLQRLTELSITCRSVVVNMVTPASECAFCAARWDEQRQRLEALDALGPALIQAPLFPHEIRGLAGLARMAGAIYGDGNG